MGEGKTGSKRKGRQETHEKLLKALGRVLARDGFTGVGINAVAREAGVDKVLIYRYFGGLSGLLADYGRQEALWPDLGVLTGGDPARFARLPPRDRACLLARNFAAALRSRPVVLEILVWEMVEKNELTALLALQREQTARGVEDLFRPAPGEPELRVDIAAAMAMATASLSYLAARARTSPAYAGVELDNDVAWKRLSRAMDGMLLGLMSFG